MIFTSTIYLVFYFPEIFVSTDMQSQNSINKYKDTALSPMCLMAAFHLATPALTHLVWSLNSWFPPPNTHIFSWSTSSYKMLKTFLHWLKLFIWLFYYLLDFLSFLPICCGPSLPLSLASSHFKWNFAVNISKKEIKDTIFREQSLFLTKVFLQQINIFYF